MSFDLLPAASFFLVLKIVIVRRNPLLNPVITVCDIGYLSCDNHPFELYLLIVLTEI